jgi:hypothetical protein
VKTPIAVIEILLPRKATDAYIQAKVVAGSILAALAAEERAKNLREVGEELPRQWSVVSDEGRCIAPQVYSWAFSEVDALRYIPGESVLSSLTGGAHIVLRARRIRDATAMKRNVIAGTRASIAAALLLEEGGLTGVVNEVDVLKFDFGTWLEEIGELLGTDHAEVKHGLGIRNEYLRAKGELAGSSRGREVLGALKPYGVTRRSDLFRSYLRFSGILA